MKHVTDEELKKVLEYHLHWLNEDCYGWEDMRADLSVTDLSGKNLNGASLDGASLNGASLNGASLNGASLYHASLDRASLDHAWLNRASLDYASLNGASLNGASLNGASLNCTALDCASLDGASLADASLKNASLNRASLNGVKNIPFIPMACPDTGAFIGWKKCSGNKIVKLLIPEYAKRSSATTRKCRCDKATVLAIENIDGTSADVTEISSSRDKAFKYRLGEIVSAPDFCEDRWQECAAGIHFFLNRQEAVEY